MADVAGGGGEVGLVIAHRHAGRNVDLQADLRRAAVDVYRAGRVADARGQVAAVLHFERDGHGTAKVAARLYAQPRRAAAALVDLNAGATGFEHEIGRLVLRTPGQQRSEEAERH